MIKRVLLSSLALALATAVVTSAQESTETPQPVEFVFEFPLPSPTDEQIEDALACDLDSQLETDATAEATEAVESDACELAKQALSLAKERADNTAPSSDEIALFTQVVAANPALALDLSLLATYYNTLPLVAPPALAEQPIVALDLRYTFAGLGNSLDYTLSILNADQKPAVSGYAENSGFMPGESAEAATATPRVLSGTVDSDVIQAFGPALRDLVPIGVPFSTQPCWDYYPDWDLWLTFADGTEVRVVTKQSNAVGIGGPWQTEIDGQYYLQYSAALSEAVVDLLEALELPLGETAAMGCGGMSNPLHDAFPDSE